MKGFRVARIFGIDIEVDWSLFLILGLITWSLAGSFAKQLPQASASLHWFAAVLTALVFIFSIVFHEMAHSLVARRFGMAVKRITLYMFGGAAQFESKDGFGSPKSELLISIAGPFSSIFLAGIFYVFTILLNSPDLLPLIVIFGWLFIINVVFAAFNILPIFPMDGGRILRSILWWKMKNLIKATKIAMNMAIVLAVLLPVAGYFLGGLSNALWLGFIAWLVISMARAEYRVLLLREKQKQKEQESKSRF